MSLVFKSISPTALTAEIFNTDKSTVLPFKEFAICSREMARLEKGEQDRVPTLSKINKVFKALGYKVDLIIREVA